MPDCLTRPGEIRAFNCTDLPRARQALENYLRRKPEDPEALNLLAVIHARQGDLETAASLLVRLLASHPGEPNGYLNLANVYWQEGDLRHAFDFYDRYLELVPGDLGVLSHVARISCDTGDCSRAVDLYRKGLALAPDRVDMLNGLGLAYCQLGEYHFAESQYERALAIAPDDYLVLTNSGTAIYEFLNRNYNSIDPQERIEIEKRCEARFRKALAIKPDYPSALINLALLYSLAGRIDEAIDHFRKTLAQDPGNGGVHFCLAEIYERKGNTRLALASLDRAMACGFDRNRCLSIKGRILYQQKEFTSAIDQLSRIEAPGNGGENLVLKHTWLGKCYGRLKNPDEAFANFELANAIAGNTGEAKKIDRRRFLRAVEANRKTFDSHRLRRLPKAPEPKGKSPVFLVGFPRSGTTLLDQILNSHSSIEVIEELPLLHGVISFINAKLGPYPEIVTDLGPTRLGLLREEYFRLVGELHAPAYDAGVTVDKFPLSIVHIGLIQRMFPDAKIILALRHPYDVCLSNFMQDYRINHAMKNFLSLENTASTYALVMDLWFHYRDVFDLNLHIVRYEDVVENYGKEAKRLVEFLGLEWEERILNYHDHAACRSFIHTPSYQDVKQPIFKRARFRWKLYEKHMEPVLPLLKPYAEAFGYDPQ